MNSHLRWAIKAGFITYVSALPDGVVEVLDGATAADGAFVFPSADGVGGLAFTGAVRFSGHHGVLDVTLANPRIETVDGGIVVTVAVGDERVRFATAESFLPAGIGVVTSRSAAATDDGAFLLGGVYQAGTPLDPLQIHDAAA
jgi:hypothetical protein